MPDDVAFGIGRCVAYLTACVSIIDHKLDIVENVSLLQWRSFSANPYLSEDGCDLGGTGDDGTRGK
jgi:hypothetical protein